MSDTTCKLYALFPGKVATVLPKSGEPRQWLPSKETRVKTTGCTQHTSFQLTCDPSAVHATLHHASQKWVCLSPRPLCQGPVWPVSLLSLQTVRLTSQKY